MIKKTLISVGVICGIIEAIASYTPAPDVTYEKSFRVKDAMIYKMEVDYHNEDDFFPKPNARKVSMYLVDRGWAKPDKYDEYTPEYGYMFSRESIHTGNVNIQDLLPDKDGKWDDVVILTDFDVRSFGTKAKAVLEQIAEDTGIRAEMNKDTQSMFQFLNYGKENYTIEDEIVLDYLTIK